MLEPRERRRRIEPVFGLLPFIKMAFCLCCSAMGGTARTCARACVRACLRARLCFDKPALVEKREI